MATFIEGGKGFTQVTITSSTTWTCPAGVTQVILMGCGGGGGGMGGAKAVTNSAPYGGAGSCVTQQIISVVPNMTYTITIGAGGTGGTGRSSTGVAVAGNSGTATTFGSLALFAGAPGGGAFNTPTSYNAAIIMPNMYLNTNGYNGPFGAAAGWGALINAGSGQYYVGGGGGSSGYGNYNDSSIATGVAGGAAATSTPGINGTNGVSTNFGSGGSGGGSTNTGATAGNGGNGAGGLLMIIYSEG